MSALSYSGYRFPPDIIQRAVWRYLRFTLSFRDGEELLAERGITVTYESIRRFSVRPVTVKHFLAVLYRRAY
jgi:putative transposase